MAVPAPLKASSQVMTRRDSALEWAARAAKGGITEAQLALANYAWANLDYLKYLFWALPLAQEIERRSGNSVRRRAYAKQDLEILARCAQALLLTADPDSKHIERYLQLAAEGGDCGAQVSLGLWIARMDTNGVRVGAIPGVAHYKKAIRWLSMAGDQGVAVAWYAMSRIYLKPEFSRRSVSEARRYLEMAAMAGHIRSQLDLGLTAWRSRRMDPRSDIRAVYWLQKASGQGSEEARVLLGKIAPPVRKAEWAHAARAFFTRDMINQYPFLAARIELGYWFGLSRAEALLINVDSADHGHCLEVDIRNEHPRSRRRLIQVQTGEQRQALDRVSRTFDTVDGGTIGPEGNYRQRLYRFRSLMTTRRHQVRKTTE
jgi:TPR repeat protein